MFALDSANRVFSFDPRAPQVKSWARSTGATNGLYFDNLYLVNGEWYQHSGNRLDPIKDIFSPPAAPNYARFRSREAARDWFLAVDLPLPDELADLRPEKGSRLHRPTPDQADLRPRMKVKEANEEAMKVAKQMGKAFFFLSERAQARRIGCHWKTWTRTPFFKKAKLKRARLLGQSSQGHAAGSPSTITLTSDLQAVTGEGERGEVMEQSIAREEALNRLIADQAADYESSSAEDDPPDSRPKKVYTRKRL
jgi:hypothetical protein